MPSKSTIWRRENPERATAYSRQYYAEHREQFSDYNRTWRRENLARIIERPSEATRRDDVRTRTAARLTTLAGRPCPDVCELCGAAPGANKSLQFDHDHATGEFRGWLCIPCNTVVIGKIDRDPTMLARIVAYLEPVMKGNI